MKRIVTLLVLMSCLAFGTTTQEIIINKTLSYEGVQKLGNSKRGIELSTLKTYNKLKGTSWKLDTLTHNQAVEILKELYWFDRLDYITSDWVKFALFDFGMNTNPSKAYQLLHKAFGLKSQSVLSLELVAKLNSLSPKEAVYKVCGVRENYLRSLSKFKTYGKGWLRRINDIRYNKI